MGKKVRMKIEVKGLGTREFQAKAMIEQRKIGPWEQPYRLLWFCGGRSLVHHQT